VLVFISYNLCLSVLTSTGCIAMLALCYLCIHAIDNMQNFHRKKRNCTPNCTPNFSKDESHGLHISIVNGPGIPNKLRSGDCSRFSCMFFIHTLKMYGARTLMYFLKFPIWHSIIYHRNCIETGGQKVNVMCTLTNQQVAWRCNALQFP